MKRHRDLCIEMPPPFNFIEVRHKSRHKHGRHNMLELTMNIKGEDQTFGLRRSSSVEVQGLGWSRREYKLVHMTPEPRPLSEIPQSSDGMNVVAVCAKGDPATQQALRFKFLATVTEEWKVMAFMMVFGRWIFRRQKQRESKHRRVVANTTSIWQMQTSRIGYKP
ncbi:Uu.00g131920.m01.CDS01 [Anthostomella pinea]|uniref:Uu.00g131920.m01.CDS01 n=1 Tax=Anthostomella pinea TaxID=933095 RepID=A0AAI8VIX1_9PEZI|nr:Uu.00g131920.m01.CDS01 [Anthostomella pinea]